MPDDFDMAKVNMVRRLLRAGCYTVDAQGIADRILLEALAVAVHDRLAGISRASPEPSAP